MTTVDLHNCESYIINLDKDAGRKKCSGVVADVFKSKYWSATDPNVLTEDGYVVGWLPQNYYTKSAKNTKLKLLQHFMATSKAQYLIVFEDDIYLHNGLLVPEIKNVLFAKINKLLKFGDPYIVYFGVSRNVQSKQNDINNVLIEPLYRSFSDGKMHACAGAYSFIINRNAIPIVMARINNKTFEEDPFDLSALSYVTKTYPEKVYITHPPLCVPDISFSNIRDGMNQTIVWHNLNIESSAYHEMTDGLMLVNITTITEFAYFRKMITMITPIVKVVYIAQSDEERELLYKTIKNTQIYLEEELQFDHSTYKYIINTTTNLKLKYKYGALLLKLLESSDGKYSGIGFIEDSTKDEVMTVEYNNNIIEDGNSKLIVVI
jgi:hypothetical protein